MPRKLSLDEYIAPAQNKNVMRDKHYIPPVHKGAAFNCPHCGAYAHQIWQNLGYAIIYDDPRLLSGEHAQIEERNRRVIGYAGPLVRLNRDKGLVSSSSCSRCEHLCLWSDEKMIFPDINSAPQPNDDLPEKAMKNYSEAASVFSRSPRAAAAMLRLAVQDICVHLGGKGKNMQADIDYLIKEKGLSQRLVKAMDSVRIVGNNAIHPGEIDLQDDTQTVGVLFGIVNRIAEKLITEPRTDDEFYNDLPDSQKRENIPEK